MDEKATHIDEAALQRLVSLLGSADEILELFGSEAPPLYRALQKAVDEHDKKAITENAHSLKSNAWEVGALPLGDLCKRVELAGRNGVMDGLPELLEEIDQEFEAVLACLARL